MAFFASNPYKTLDCLEIFSHPLDPKSPIDTTSQGEFMANKFHGGRKYFRGLPP